MKTSNKLIAAAIVVLLISLFIFDNLLKAEYTSGRYKDPLRGYVNLKYQDFDTVNLPSSTVANVKFVQGPFKVSVDQITSQFFKFEQKGRCLTISADLPESKIYSSKPYFIIVSCPRLVKLYAGARYLLNHRTTIDVTAWYARTVMISGFNEDSLSVRQDYGSTVILAGNQIRSLTAEVGKSYGSGSCFTILKGNQLQQASLDIYNNSQLEIYDARITHLKYHLADSAKLLLNGITANSLREPKP